VQWFLLQNPVPITPDALIKLHNVIGLFPNYSKQYPNNNRPIANQNGRPVLKSNRNDD
jgi:carbonic anhydrase